ncbi:hypothetical protein [uncultured Reyranella sp.]|uniref:hypothetical protein n=1 Tax=uncultured Reyranella sp. TaxID=735512 RepID=UPI0025DDA922|nr:hypothetical protein [uncultured Reyranella sp.]
MDDVTLARAFHVLAIVHWIGGMAFMTLVVLPAARDTADPREGLALFESVEGRFSPQVRLSVPLAGLSGFYMAERLDAWPRFLDPAQWWLGAMVLLWLLFMTVLFVVEPAIGPRLLEAGHSDPEGLLRRVARVHWLLLGASAVVAGGAVLGAHGLLG